MAETRLVLLLFRHGSETSTGMCMCVYYEWFLPLSECTLSRHYSHNRIRIDLRVF